MVPAVTASRSSLLLEKRHNKAIAWLIPASTWRREEVRRRQELLQPQASQAS